MLLPGRVVLAAAGAVVAAVARLPGVHLRGPVHGRYLEAVKGN